MRAITTKNNKRATGRLVTVGLLGWLLITGCGSSSSNSSTDTPSNPPDDGQTAKPLTAQMVLDLSENAGFFDAGFPSSVQLKANGTVDFSRFPREKHVSTADWRDVAELTDGYSPMSPIYLRFNGDLAEQPEQFNLLQSATGYLDENAPVQLINIDPQSPEYGRRHPLNVGYYAEPDKYRPGNLLAVQPLGRLMLENTDYALIVTRSIHNQSQQTPVNPMLDSLLKGISPLTLDNTISPITAAKALQGYAPLRQWIADQQMDREQILAATVWRTGQPTAYLQNLVDQMASWPVQLNEPWQLLDNNDQFCAIRSSWQVPVLIEGLSGYLLPVFGGGIELDDQGAPLVQHYRQSEIVLSIPKDSMPEAGYPLMVYNHGTDGRADQILTRGYTNAEGVMTNQGVLAEIAAYRGWAVSGMAGHMGAEHQDLVDLWDGLFDGIDEFSFNHFSYNPLNPLSMRNNLLQMIVERVMHRRLINQQLIDPAICGLDNVQPISFDSSNQVAAGQSLGSFTASAMAAVDPQGYRGMSISGAGTFSLDLVLNFYVGERYLSSLFEPAYWQLPAGTLKDDPLHPFWALAEAALAPANTGLQINRWRYEKPQQTPHTLIFEGFFDSQVSVTSQRLLLRASGSDFAGEELQQAEYKQLLPAVEISGGQQLDYPVQGNQDGITNVVVRYAQDANLDGHHILFQYPQAKHQLGCFLEGISSQQAPVVVAGENIDSSCQISTP